MTDIDKLPYDSQERLLKDARKLQELLPQKTIEELYAYLEANMDDKNRFEKVLNALLESVEYDEEMDIKEMHSDQDMNADFENNVEVSAMEEELKDTFPEESIRFLEKMEKELGDGTSPMIVVPNIIENEYEGGPNFPEKRSEKGHNKDRHGTVSKGEQDKRMIENTFCKPYREDVDEATVNIRHNRNELEYKKTSQQDAVNESENFLECASIENFLQSIPEPLEYFSDTRKIVTTSYKEHAFSYMLHKFNFSSEGEIRNELLSQNSLLFPTFKHLMASNIPLNQNSDWKVPENAGKLFLHEVEFIEKEEEITKYLKDKAKAREKTFEAAKVENRLLECNCCVDDECLQEETISCTSGHVFCKPCVWAMSNDRYVREEDLFQCLAVNCTSKFKQGELEAALQPAKFLLDVNQEFLEEGRKVKPQKENMQNMNSVAENGTAEICNVCNLKIGRINPLEDSVGHQTYKDNEYESRKRVCLDCKENIDLNTHRIITCRCGALTCSLCKQSVGRKGDDTAKNTPNGVEVVGDDIEETRKVVQVETGDKNALPVDEEGDRSPSSDSERDYDFYF